jgi:AraC-like DNA-binding protein
MNWITRERPKIDRIASPWLIKNFVDKDAVFFFVPFEEVLKKSEDLKGIPFDIPRVEYTHYGEEATFDYILKKHGLEDPVLKKMAVIVRGADTDRPNLAPEVAGLWAISAGLSYNIKDDYLLLETGFKIYDALYSWAKHLESIKHLDNSPFERQLHEVYLKFLKPHINSKKNSPKWVNELKSLIQDQLDTQFTVDLKFIAEELNINSSYLSREFSKHFDNKNFGQYIREKRIDRAIELLHNNEYSLTEIAYLTGFSDQSHFTRTFRSVVGKNPSSFRKNLNKGKANTKGK